MIERQLFDGNLIRLGEIDYKKDPEVESGWTETGEYWQANDYQIPRPMSPERIKKSYESIEKAADEKRTSFYFTIREKSDDRLLGFIRLNHIEWTNGFADLAILIGSNDDREKGFGREALNLILNFSFMELNLHRLSAWVGEDNPSAIRFLQRAGFKEEVRRRESLHLNVRNWDFICMGLLRSEWLENIQKMELTS